MVLSNLLGSGLGKLRAELIADWMGLVMREYREFTYRSKTVGVWRVSGLLDVGD